MSNEERKLLPKDKVEINLYDGFVVASHFYDPKTNYMLWDRYELKDLPNDLISKEELSTLQEIK